MKSIKSPGSPRVEGDEEEDDTDDLENEFDYASNDPRDPRYITEAMVSTRLNVGHGSQVNDTQSEVDSSSIAPGIRLLTYGQEVNIMFFFFNLILLLVSLL